MANASDKGYSVFILLNGKILEADWKPTKAAAKRAVDYIFEHSIQDVKVVITVNLETGEVIAGRSNLHTYP